MPSTSKKQRNFMAAAAHNPEFAKKVGISTKVAKEFNAADKGRKFGTGGNVTYTFGGKGQANKQRTRGGSIDGYQKDVPDVNNNKYAGMKAGGLPAAINKQKTHHTAGGVPNFANKAFKKGGETMKHDDIKQDKPMMKQIAGVEATKVVNKHEKKMHGMCGGGAAKVKKMSAGGKARGCGIASKGLTKGKIC